MRCPPAHHPGTFAAGELAHAKDGEVAALAKVVVHGRAFPFLLDTGAAKRW
jgi:hypothetical protein